MSQANPEPIVAVGTIGIDTIETPTERVEAVLGGSGTYFAVAASLFNPVCLVAVAGDDMTEAQWSTLRRPNLILDGIAVVKGGRTFSWGGRYHADVNRRDTLFTNLGVLETFNPVVPASQRGARTVFLANVDPGSQLKVLDQVSGAEFVVTDTMNFWISGDRERLGQVLRRTDCLILNDDEARQLTGCLNLTDALEKVQALGPRMVVLKKGEHGAVLAVGRELFALPGYPLRNVVDPTGAGDSFAGGFVGYIQRRGDRSRETLRAAVVYGSAVASFCCEDFSLRRLGRLSQDELEARVQEFRELVRFQ
ncbi:PfkB family carbohydrate kinase [bacterium]|nr:PfkB family carbohydrate kinase [bacterium]